MGHTQNETELVAENPPEHFRLRRSNSHVFWLNEGANYFGSDARNHIVLSGEQTASYAGILFLKHGRIFIRVAAGQKITHNKKAIDNIFIHAEKTSLVLEYGWFELRIIQKERRYGFAVFCESDYLLQDANRNL